MANQAPDTQAGNYYVTVVDGSRYGILAGPFPNDHARALELVDQARALAQRGNPRAHFYGYGTARFPADFTEPGVLNGALGIS